MSLPISYPKLRLEGIDLNLHLQTEEEIKIYETPEDMPEVARNMHLLRKGMAIQKLSVSLLTL